jgi:hypothetical protein
VTADKDDDALTWAGGRDPSHYETPVAKAPKRPKPSDAEPSGDPLPPVTSGALLIALGIFCGIYALYTIGWFVSWQRFDYGATNLLDAVAFAAQQWLAIIAPEVWFTTVLLLTRRRKPATRLLWLVIGALVLIPWSFALGK